MDLKTQETLFKNFTDSQRNIMLKKGNDYAGEDRLANFKIAGVAAGLTPSQQCLSLITTKIARLNNLLSNSLKPNYESTEDTVKDLANYSFLLYCILNEEQKLKRQHIMINNSKPNTTEFTSTNSTSPIESNYTLLKG